MISITMSNEKLSTYFNHASKNDWYSPLKDSLSNLTKDELIDLKNEVESEIGTHQFYVKGSLNYILQTYLMRIRQLCHVRLMNEFSITNHNNEL